MDGLRLRISHLPAEDWLRQNGPGVDAQKQSQKRHPSRSAKSEYGSAGGGEFGFRSGDV